jgi:hypothetical protein
LLAELLVNGATTSGEDASKASEFISSEQFVGPDDARLESLRKVPDELECDAGDFRIDAGQARDLESLLAPAEKSISDALLALQVVAPDDARTRLLSAALRVLIGLRNSDADDARRFDSIVPQPPLKLPAVGLMPKEAAGKTDSKEDEASGGNALFAVAQPRSPHLPTKHADLRSGLISISPPKLDPPEKEPPDFNQSPGNASSSAGRSATAGSGGACAGLG